MFVVEDLVSSLVETVERVMMVLFLLMLLSPLCICGGSMKHFACIEL